MTWHCKYLYLMSGINFHHFIKRCLFKKAITPKTTKGTTRRNTTSRAIRMSFLAVEVQRQISIHDLEKIFYCCF